VRERGAEPVRRSADAGSALWATSGRSPVASVECVRDIARRHPVAFDLVLAAILVALSVLSLHAASDEAVFGGYSAYPRPLGYAVTLAPLAALTLRRRYPLGVLVTSSVAAVVAIEADIPELGISALGYFIAIYSAGAYGAALWRNRVRVVSVLAVGLSLLWFVVVDAAEGEMASNLRLQLFTVFTNLAYFAAAWLMGDYSRERLGREIELLDRADLLERTRAENTRRAVIDERVRIARELHDVVAHHVSVMGVQAGAARRVLVTRPTVAQDALSSIEASSRQAVDELNRLLGFLRQEGDVDTLAPSPTLDQIDSMVEQFRRDAALDVVLTVQGERRPVPPGVDLSAFRVVQEALTNTLKHAGPAARAEVTVRFGSTELEIDVLDDGRGPGLGERGGDGECGHGLIGMRERATLHGADLRTGRRRGGGFEVRARFPLPPTAEHPEAVVTVRDATVPVGGATGSPGAAGNGSPP